MPTNHLGNTANGNAISGLASMGGHSLAGRLTGLAIYEIRYFDLANSPLSGPNFATIVKSMKRDNIQDAAQGYRQPTNHGDALGNLPLAPGGRIVYREYYVTGNTLLWPGFPRIVADPGSKRLFFTPTHYDVWSPSTAVATGMPIAALMPPATVGARNPFFYITGVGAVNDMFL